MLVIQLCTVLYLVDLSILAQLAPIYNSYFVHSSYIFVADLS